jgi:hypothetical protein
MPVTQMRAWDTFTSPGSCAMSRRAFSESLTELVPLRPTLRAAAQ